MRTFLKVYRSGADAGRPLFYFEAVEAAGPDVRTSAGPWGWVERRFHRIKQGFRHPTGSTGRTARRVWDWLHERTHPDEPLYSRFRSATRVELRYPATMDEEQARAEWTSFLGRGRLRHWLWLVVDVAFLPLTLLLMPLPGPNLIGYWFLYRAVHHVLILIGLAKVRRGYVATGFTAEKGLDGRDPAERLLAVGCEPESVVGFLRRHQVRTDTPVHQP